jgi:hypothetical protein
MGRVAAGHALRFDPVLESVAGNYGAGLLDRFGESAANRSKDECRYFALWSQR